VSYLLLYETSVIVAAGLLLNYIGLTLSRHLESILFLDMTGTALVAFLLGPWWGAIVALLSNSVVNWLLYPETGGDVVIFPWSLVNIAGAL
jgi:energy-coupling factor transport system substrate-specific component